MEKSDDGKYDFDFENHIRWSDPGMRQEVLKTVDFVFKRLGRLSAADMPDEVITMLQRALFALLVERILDLFEGDPVSLSLLERKRTDIGLLYGLCSRMAAEIHAKSDLHMRSLDADFSVKLHDHIRQYLEKAFPDRKKVIETFTRLSLPNWN